MDGKFSVGYRDAMVRTVVGLDRETTAAYILVLEAIGKFWLPCILSAQLFQEELTWGTRPGAKTLS